MDPQNSRQPASTFVPQTKSLRVGTPILVGGLIIIIAGTLTGWLLSGKGSLKTGNSPSTATGAKTSANEAGVSDEKAFPDSAEGKLAEGGIQGEGTYHLERDGGPSRYVYLTSTVIDLQGFVGKKVKVWGQTIKGKKAGWLMDVGKVKVTE